MTIQYINMDKFCSPIFFIKIEVNKYRFYNKIGKCHSIITKARAKSCAFYHSRTKKTQKFSITELVKATEVSNATITRLTRKLKCKNFAELKLNLASLDQPQPSIVKTKDKTLHEVYDFLFLKKIGKK